MKLKKISTLCFAASTLFAASSAMAWESEDGAHSTSASIALASDYVWRGASQTSEKAAISGSFDYAHSSGFYLGTWASNVDFGPTDDSSIEIDLYAGFASDIGETGISYDVGYLRYVYDGENYDYNEMYGSLGYSYFTLGLTYTNDYYSTGESGFYYNLGFDYDLPMGVSLSAGVGVYDYSSGAVREYFGGGDVDKATDFRIGLSKEMAGFGFDVTYTDSDSDGEQLYGKDIADGRVVFTISKSL